MWVFDIDSRGRGHPRSRPDVTVVLGVDARRVLAVAEEGSTKESKYEVDEHFSIAREKK